MPTVRSGKAARISLISLAITALMTAAHPAFADEAHSFHIAAADASTAVREFAQQSGVQIMASADALKEKNLNPVAGEHTTEDALNILLADTGLDHQYVGERGVVIAAADPQRVEVEEIVVGVPEVLVTGSKILNTDIARSRDDAQPYVIFNRKTIERAAAVDLQDFLKSRLTMNSAALTNNLGSTAFGNTSSVNLRGLGSGQTLILIDGHRVAGAGTNSGSQLQPDLNAIPLSAIERIEVLPTASGMYGAGATAGVVNVILRRDYEGLDTKVTYEDTFETSAPNRRVDIGAGFNLDGGRTSVIFAGSYAQADDLRIGERDLSDRARAELLANNPQFFYGTQQPPLGATPNIRSSNGTNLVLRPEYGGANLRSSFTTVPVGYRGVATDGVAPLVANVGKYNLDLADTAQFSGGRTGALVNGSTLRSLMATVHQQFTSKLQAFVDLGMSTNESVSPFSSFSGSYTINANAPNNPFMQQIRVTVPSAAADGVLRVEVDSRRAVGGVIARLPGDWQAEADYTWNRVRFERDPTPGTSAAAGADGVAVSNGSLDVLRDTVAFPVDFSRYLATTVVTPIDSTLKNTTLRVAGPIINLPGGPAVLTTLIERREENIDDAYQYTATQTLFNPGRSQTANSAYLEVKVPLVSVLNRRTGIEELDLQLAARRDEYTVNGVTGTLSFSPGATPVVERRANKSSSNNPMFGLRYRPISDLMFRASFGTGFLPPGVQQLVPNTTPTNVSVIDRRRGNAPTTVRVFTGGNPALSPEESKSLTLGAVLEPRFAPGLRLSVDYTEIDKTDEIRNVSQQGIIDNEEFFPGRVTRGSPVDDPLGVGIIDSVDATLLNVARSKLEAFDVAIDYNYELGGWGTLGLFSTATWTNHYLTQLQPVLPFTESAGITALNPTKFKANVGVNWELHNWSAGWATRYLAHYKTSSNAAVILSQGGEYVPSQLYHDVFAGYSFPRGDEGLLSDVQIQAGVKNVFNKRPPFDANMTSIYYSPFGDPRLATYYVSIRKAF